MFSLCTYRDRWCNKVGLIRKCIILVYLIGIVMIIIKKYWQHIISVRGKESKKIDSLVYDGIEYEVVGDEKVSADGVNKIFLSAIISLSEKFQVYANMNDDFHFLQRNILDDFQIPDITLADTLGAVNEVVGKPSTAFDGYNWDLLAPPLTPLTALFNKSIENGVFPDVLKTSVVVPVYKSGDEKEISNYRPISILSVILKFFEKIVKEFLITFLLSKNYFGENNLNS